MERHDPTLRIRQEEEVALIARPEHVPDVSRSVLDCLRMRGGHQRPQQRIVCRDRSGLLPGPLPLIFRSSKRFKSVRNLEPGVPLKVGLRDQQTCPGQQCRSENQRENEFCAKPGFAHCDCALRNELVARSMNRLEVSWICRIRLDLLAKLYQVII